MLFQLGMLCNSDGTAIGKMNQRSWGDGIEKFLYKCRAPAYLFCLLLQGEFQLLGLPGDITKDIVQGLAEVGFDSSGLTSEQVGHRAIMTDVPMFQRLVLAEEFLQFFVYDVSANGYHAIHRFHFAPIDVGGIGVQVVFLVAQVLAYDSDVHSG